ncbi:hypothetical protein OPIT5_22115 [Opitutaceae bacterium TAV5]|nr:hypothetical protein OPIT5_22115 [Opitutaceae bacterium TAV5]
MKTLFLPAILLLAGCQSSDPVLTPLPDFPPDDTPAPARAIADTSAVSDWEETIRRQKLILKALAEHNDTLTARIKAIEPEPSAELLPPIFVGASEAPRHEEPETPPVPAAAPPPPPSLPANAVVHVPNADGRIDLTITEARKSALPNPFAVRTPKDETANSARETVINVQGIFGGATPSALVNDRVCQVGDRVESFRVAHIAADSLLLSTEESLVFLKLPLGTTAIRLP